MRLRISSRVVIARSFVAGLPPVAEAGFGDGFEVAEPGPAAGHAGEVGQLAFALEEELAGAGEALGGFVAAMAEEDFRGGLHRDDFRELSLPVRVFWSSRTMRPRRWISVSGMLIFTGQTS